MTIEKNFVEETTSVLSTPEPINTKQRKYPCLLVIGGANTGQLYKFKKQELSIGRSAKNDIPILEEGISRSHCVVYSLPGNEFFIQDLNSTNGTFINGKKIQNEQLKDGDKIQIGLSSIFKFTYQDKIEEEFQRYMLENSLKDHLTNVFNRRYFDERILSEFSFGIRHNTDLTIIYMCIDNFKIINDTYGKLCGDLVLREFAGRLESTIRIEDVLARYDGDEFIIIARDISPKGGILFAERLRQAINIKPFSYESTEIPITASFGVATNPHNKAKTPMELVNIAHKFLLKAKESGRNCVYSE